MNSQPAAAGQGLLTFNSRTGAMDLVLGGDLKIKVVVHEAAESGYWAEVPAIPGCATQGETMEELMANVHEAIEACLLIEIDPLEYNSTDRILEVTL